jgi:hypothetical protein
MPDQDHQPTEAEYDQLQRDHAAELARQEAEHAGELSEIDRRLQDQVDAQQARIDEMKARDAAAIAHGDPEQVPVDIDHLDEKVLELTDVHLPIDTVRVIARECAGLGAGIIMKLAPTVEFPSEDVDAGVEGVLDELLTPAVKAHRARIEDCIGGALLSIPTPPARWGHTFDLGHMRDAIAGWLQHVIDREAERMANPPVDEASDALPAHVRSAEIAHVGSLTASLRAMDEICMAQPQPVQNDPQAGTLLVDLDEACSVAWNTLSELGCTTATSDSLVDALRKRWQPTPAAIANDPALRGEHG